MRKPESAKNTATHRSKRPQIRAITEPVDVPVRNAT